MASSKPSSSSNKRKSQWPDVEDSFSTSKKQRVVKQEPSPSVSMHDFVVPSFQPRPPSTKAREKIPSASLHASASDLLFKKENKTTPKKPSLPLARLDTPQPPGLLIAEPRPPAHLISVLEMAPPRFDQASSLHTPSKPLRSALRTPLISGAFTSPPKSQKLTLPINELLDDETPALNPMQAELNRGLAPSPEKGSYSSKKQFIRGGLADRAKALMSRATTDFSLWYEDSASSKKASEAPLLLRILEVISSNPPKELPLIPSVFPHGTSPRQSVLARCKRLGDQRAEEGNVLVLFSHFSSSQSDARRKVADPAAVAPGLEAQIWKPWTEIYIPLKGYDPEDSQSKVILCSRFIIK